MLIFKHRPKYFEFIACVEKCDLSPDKTSDFTSPKRRKFLRIDTLVNMVKGSIVCSRYSCLVQYSGFYWEAGLDTVGQPYSVIRLYLLDLFRLYCLESKSILERGYCFYVTILKGNPKIIVSVQTFLKAEPLQSRNDGNGNSWRFF